MNRIPDGLSKFPDRYIGAGRNGRTLCAVRRPEPDNTPLLEALVLGGNVALALLAIVGAWWLVKG